MTLTETDERAFELMTMPMDELRTLVAQYITESEIPHLDRETLVFEVLDAEGLNPDIQIEARTLT